jgi:hypothetical protein
MALRPSTLKDLTTEYEALKRQRQEIDARMNAILLIIRKRRTQPWPISLSDESVQSPPSSSGLRAMLRATLVRGAMTPRDVIKAIRENGFKATGKTSIEMRVYNELARMKRDGLTRKDSEGRYTLTS